MPDYSTLSRRQKKLSVAIAARRSSAGLNLLIDSTGLKMPIEGEKRNLEGYAQARAFHLEEMERLSPPQPCREQDGMLREIGRARDDLELPTAGD